MMPFDPVALSLIFATFLLMTLAVHAAVRWADRDVKARSDILLLQDRPESTLEHQEFTHASATHEEPMQELSRGSDR